MLAIPKLAVAYVVDLQCLWAIPNSRLSLYSYHAKIKSLVYKLRFVLAIPQLAVAYLQDL